MNRLADNPVNLLLIEDNEGDVILTEHAFSQGKYTYNIINKKDGEEATQFLSDSTQIKPDIILLDINLPKIDGPSILKKIKTDPNLRAIPVIMLTSSSADRDIGQCYDLHANAYIIKPSSLDDFIDIAKAIENFWISTATYLQSQSK